MDIYEKIASKLTAEERQALWVEADETPEFAENIIRAVANRNHDEVLENANNVRFCEVTLKVIMPASEAGDTDDELARNAMFTAMHYGAQMLAYRYYTEDMDTHEIVDDEGTVEIR